MTLQEIRAHLRKAGKPVPALSTLSAIVKSGRSEAPSKPKAKRASKPSRPQDAAPQPDHGSESRDVSRAALREHLRQSQEVLSEERGEPAELVALGTSIRHDVAALQKLDPEPPPPVEDPPDMIEAADRGLAKLIEYVERGT